MSDLLSGILTRRVPCPACAEENDFRAETCVACGAQLNTEDEERLSYMSSETPAAADVDLSSLTPEQREAVEKMRTKIPLERSANYVMLKETTQGAIDGTMSAEQFRTNVRKLRNIGDAGVKVLQNKVVRNKMSALSEEAQKARDAMCEGFQMLLDGCVRMETWLTSGDMNDLVEGSRTAEAGYRRIDEAQDAALQLR